MDDRVFGKLVFTQEAIKNRVREIGRKISVDYHDKDLLMVGVLKGAYAFLADLSRAVALPIRVDFLVVTGGRIFADLAQNIAGQDVLIVEDIVDSGETFAFLKKELMARHPKSLRICTLLDKPHRRKANIDIDYIGFTVQDKFVVGYGLDYKNRYRNLPYIAVLDKVSEDEEA
ncbi:MAG: hypoxanthine phosphoribosyltransferase [Nitrospirae bacterium]|nr:hypoxanthine phosphoribosyltransferase [Candidatus Troglogloeales bacterium]MBI3598965.1 hypoxanthine phosphoribosyltransferase [Candidatus Troglogloeales bacterium]